jgi:hypothetical protein
MMGELLDPEDVDVTKTEAWEKLALAFQEVPSALSAGRLPLRWGNFSKHLASE